MSDLELAPCTLETASLHEAELRRHPRHICVDGTVLRLAVRPEFKGRRALLVDVSTGGIGLLMEDPLDAGTMLTFELQGKEATQPVGRIARVRHSRPHPVPADAPWLQRPAGFTRFFRAIFGAKSPPPKPQAWIVGCEFDRPLTEDEIMRLLEQLKANAG